MADWQPPPQESGVASPMFWYVPEGVLFGMLNAAWPYPVCANSWTPELIDENEFQEDMERYVDQFDMPPLSNSREVSATSSSSPCSRLSRIASPVSCFSEGAEQQITFINDELDQEGEKVRDHKQNLFEAVEEAARTAYPKEFQRLEIVGSAALKVDHPFSDLDAVLFGPKSEEPVMVLRKIAGVLRKRYPEWEEIDVVPAKMAPPVLYAINRVNGKKFSIDVTLNEKTAVNHVRWFERSQSVGNRREEALFLRCIKWWLHRRAIPTTKEGGFPSIVWLLMAVHIYRHAVVDLVRSSSKRKDASPRGLLRMLATFFGFFGNAAGFHGTIHFDAEGATHFDLLAEGLSMTEAKAPDAIGSTIHVWFGSPDVEVTNDVLWKYFEQRFGRVINVVMPVEHDGQAFVSFANLEASTLAAQTREQKVAGVPITVTPAKPPVHEFCIRNVPQEVTVEELRRCFSRFGTVLDGTLADGTGDDGTKRGTIVMADASGTHAIEEARRRQEIALHGQTLELRRAARDEKNNFFGADLLNSFSVLDPTSPHKDLAPRMSRATQLLHLSEMQRASDLLQGIVAGERGTGRERIHSLFEEINEGANQLPSTWPQTEDSSADLSGSLCGAIFLSDDGKTLYIGVLQAIIFKAVGINGKGHWSLPHLLRRDCKSEVHVLLCEVTESVTGRCTICCAMSDQRKAVFHPCHFVCRIHLQEEEEPGTWSLTGECQSRYLCIKLALPTLIAQNEQLDSPQTEPGAPTQASGTSPCHGDAGVNGKAKGKGKGTSPCHGDAGFNGKAKGEGEGRGTLGLSKQSEARSSTESEETVRARNVQLLDAQLRQLLCTLVAQHCNASKEQGLLVNGIVAEWTKVYATDMKALMQTCGHKEVEELVRQIPGLRVVDDGLDVRVIPSNSDKLEEASACTTAAMSPTGLVTPSGLSTPCVTPTDSSSPVCRVTDGWAAPPTFAAVPREA